MIISNLIDTAVQRAGSQQNLAKTLKIKYITRFGDYKAGRRVPDDILIGQLAEYVGLNPIETILLCKLETVEQEKATLLRTWLENWHSIGDSNPCYRRERVYLLHLKIWQGFYNGFKGFIGGVGVFLRG